jgi:hypothetical protein
LANSARPFGISDIDQDMWAAKAPYLAHSYRSFLVAPDKRKCDAHSQRLCGELRRL